ncbi:MAG TPA: inositol monophosphatase family protein [Candidatus Dormibacteraeota bacterium]|jgi:histidinol-phosphatase|nr:inositol monophosphatase family protein [Candidatus Dormibacteraeota bacterium]
MTEPALDDDLRLALRLADIADAITMAGFRGEDLRVETKADRSPVTDVDRRTEQALRSHLGAERPGDAVVGEEYGESGAGGRRWFLDPIDGTKNFVRRIPVFATLIGLEQDGEIVVGVCSAPALHARWWAARGMGAFESGRRIRVSGVSQLAEAHLSYDDVAGFEEHGMGDRFLALARRCYRSRGFGDFWSHVMVAEGAVDVAVEPEVNPWDLAPLRVIVEEAGGRFTDLRGEARIDGGSAVSSNGLLHDDVLTALR